MANRGQLNTAVQKAAKKFLGTGLTTTELRLIPYLQYVMVNEQRIEIHKINQEERVIIQKWKDLGHMEGGVSGLSVTREFWDFMCEILFYAYVGPYLHDAVEDELRDINEI